MANKPGGSGKASRKPKYDGLTFNVDGLPTEDQFLVCGAANGICLHYLKDNSGDWAMSVIVGGQGATLDEQKRYLVNRSGGWPDVPGAEAKYPSFASAMDAYVAWRQSLPKKPNRHDD